jgi:GT2 family glycosyltransferase
VDIIVVDNGSVDDSVAVARRAGATVVNGHGRVSALRNLGARQATGDILAFVDADHEIGSGWVVSARDALRPHGAGVAGAAYRSPIDGTWVQRAYGDLRGHPAGQHDAGWLASGNMAVWRRVFEQVGGFDTGLEACEDVDFCQRVRVAGYRVISDARLDTVHHGDPETLTDVFRSELWRGRDNLRVSLRSPFSWRDLPSALIPVIDIAMAAVAIIGLLAALSGRTFGFVFAGLALGVILAGAVAKVLRSRMTSATPQAPILATFLVACVYDCARALALFARTPHRGTARSPVTTAT